ncbi:MAG: AAA family ATPase [Prevotellaceae bacterium]|nr:AAA family ATPase [Prevotellaceae bacterium]MDD6009644.1 AAA family ATPase [Prevotellaceae bacterium]MDD6111094.1 AAA family ATPase [Prevotellaceae bacterium]MDD6779982.1 AAA family ATPase [Prevotellaceae bacterium]
MKVFKRKIYNKLKDWKSETKGTKALLIEGARRIGKSTIAEEFAKNEYRSYILIDFNLASDTVISAFNNYLNDLDTFFMIIESEYNKKLYRRESVVIFDEIQRFPKARQAVKYLVADGRFDYIETGSLISIRENVENITLPSEERKMAMYPMDFEEFAWALGEEVMADYIRKCYEKRMPLEQSLHAKAMMLFRQYMIVGGMPQSILAYIGNDRDFRRADMEKRDILEMYRSDIMKIRSSYKSGVIALFDQIPSFLSHKERRVVMNRLDKNATFPKYHDTFFWLADSMMVNQCFNCSDPNVGLSLNEDRTYVKCYMCDTGLLVSHTFSEREITDNALYRELLFGNLSINEGMFYENAISQMLVANGYKLFFYTRYNEEKHRNDIEIDFLISNNSKLKYKVYPIEVKSSDRYTTTSLERFEDRFHQRIGGSYVIHPKNLKAEGGRLFIPAYMTFCL